MNVTTNEERSTLKNQELGKCIGEKIKKPELEYVQALKIKPENYFPPGGA